MFLGAFPSKEASENRISYTELKASGNVGGHMCCHCARFP